MDLGRVQADQQTLQHLHSVHQVALEAILSVTKLHTTPDMRFVRPTTLLKAKLVVVDLLPRVRSVWYEATVRSFTRGNHAPSSW